MFECTFWRWAREEPNDGGRCGAPARMRVGERLFFCESHAAEILKNVSPDIQRSLQVKYLT